MKKVRSGGFSHHLLLPVIAVLFVAAIGVFMIARSRAASSVGFLGVPGYYCPVTSTSTLPITGTTTANVAKILPVLKKGSSGQCVKAAQYMLNQWMSSKNISVVYNGQTMFNVSVDGQYGPRTVAVVKKFQAYYKLGVDGSIGKNTWTNLQYCTTRYSSAYCKSRGWLLY